MCLFQEKRLLLPLLSLIIARFVTFFVLHSFFQLWTALVIFGMQLRTNEVSIGFHAWLATSARRDSGNIACATDFSLTDFHDW